MNIEDRDYQTPFSVGLAYHLFEEYRHNAHLSVYGLTGLLGTGRATYYKYRV